MSGVQSVSAVFPCYNDARTIAGVVEAAAGALERLGLEHELIVVDDGSGDESASVLAGLEARMPRLRVVTHRVNRGYGGALRSGFAAATMQWVFYTDGDGQYDPAQLVRLVERADPSTDVVQGYKRGRADSRLRKVAGAAYGRVMRIAFRLPVRDVDCDFRLMRRELLADLDLTASSGAICVELVSRLRYAGARIVEVEVDHFPRLHGRSQFFRPARVLATFRDVSSLWLRMVLLRRGRAA